MDGVKLADVFILCPFCEQEADLQVHDGKIICTACCRVLEDDVKAESQTVDAE